MLKLVDIFKIFCYNLLQYYLHVSIVFIFKPSDEIKRRILLPRKHGSGIEILSSVAHLQWQ